MKTLILIFALVASTITYSGSSAVRLGYSALDQGNYRAAIFIFKQVVEKGGHSNYLKYLLNRELTRIYYYAPDSIDNDFKLSFRSVIKSGDVELPIREHLLGRHYYYGKGVDKDYHLAKYHLERSSNITGSLLILGRMYLHGIGIELDYQKAQELFLKGASLGDAHAQFELGHIYEYGKGVSIDRQQAIDWYQKAANQNDADAQYKFDLLSGNIKESDRVISYEEGMNYHYGFRSSIDYDEAIKRYKQAEKNHAPSMYNIGSLIDTTSPTKSRNEAIKYLTKSAEMGHVHAQIKMAQIYLNGIGVKIDKKKSFKWSIDAAANGSRIASENIAKHYYDGDFVIQDYKKSMAWHKEAVVRGSKESIYEIGRMYEIGNGVEKNQDVAMNLYTISAKSGYARAQNKLAQLYLTGIGVSIDNKEAYKWATLAAKQGNSDAQNTLGKFYETGKGDVRVDKKVAKRWYVQSANSENILAYINLAQLHKSKGDFIDAFKWYKKSAEAGSKKGQYYVGRYYLDDKFAVNKDVKLAIKWFKKSAKQGYKQSLIALGDIYYYGDIDASIAQNYKIAADWYSKAAKGNAKTENKS